MVLFYQMQQSVSSLYLCRALINPCCSFISFISGLIPQTHLCWTYYCFSPPLFLCATSTISLRRPWLAIATFYNIVALGGGLSFRTVFQNTNLDGAIRNEILSEACHGLRYRTELRHPKSVMLKGCIRVAQFYFAPVCSSSTLFIFCGAVHIKHTILAFLCWHSFKHPLMFCTS